MCLIMKCNSKTTQMSQLNRCNVFAIGMKANPPQKKKIMVIPLKIIKITSLFRSRIISSKQDFLIHMIVSKSRIVE